MKKNSDRTYWMSNKEWYKINEDTHCFELTEKAPKEAVDSFKKWNTKEKIGIRQMLRFVRAKIY